MNTYERLNKAISFLKGENIVRTDRQVAELMHVDKGNLSKALKGDTRYLTKGLLKKFNNTFSNIFSQEWLESGEGGFLESDAYYRFQEEKRDGVPYYDMAFKDFQTGFEKRLYDSKIYCRRFGSASFWCNAEGDAMTPLINHGDLIAMRELQGIDFLIYGEIYGLMLKNGINVIRKVLPSKKDSHFRVTTVNHFQESVEQEIEKKDIIAVYSVVGIMRNL